MDQKKVSCVGKAFLFRDIPQDQLALLLEKADAYCQIFSPGDEIPFSEGDFRRIGIVLSGRAAVFSRQEPHGALLNLLEEGSLFGVLSLYSEDATPPTRIICRRQAEILFLDAAKCEFLLENRKIARRLVSFLTGRIRFLNQKIASFTAPSAEKALALYLLENSDEKGEYEASLPFSSLAQMLGLGRASFYRALDSLEESGAIRRDKKKFLSDLSALRTFCGFAES